MSANFLSTIENSGSTSEQVNEKIKQALARLLYSDANDTVLRHIQKQCEILTVPYVALMQYYANSKQEENYEQIVSNFLTYFIKFAGYTNGKPHYKSF
jgi:hypothetical protein